MPEKKLNDLFYDTLKDIYFAERQILEKPAENGEGGPVGGTQERLL